MSLLLILRPHSAGGGPAVIVTGMFNEPTPTTVSGYDEPTPTASNYDEPSPSGAMYDEPTPS